MFNENFLKSNGLTRSLYFFSAFAKSCGSLSTKVYWIGMLSSTEELFPIIVVSFFSNARGERLNKRGVKTIFLDW